MAMRSGTYISAQTLVLKVFSRYIKRSDLINTWSDNKVHELIAVKVLIAEYHFGRLQSTPLGKLCTDASAESTLQNNFEVVLLNDIQSCCRISPDVMNVIKMSSFQHFLYLREQEKVMGS
jgi:hypothetical protein